MGRGAFVASQVNGTWTDPTPFFMGTLAAAQNTSRTIYYLDQGPEKVKLMSDSTTDAWAF